MKESVGYTVSLNIVIVFIVIVFAFIGGSISYYKAYKVNSIIEDSIEKYEGYNQYSIDDINRSLSSLGYDMSEIDCGEHKVNGVDVNRHFGSKIYPVNHVKNNSSRANGYCVYYNVVEMKENAKIVGDVDSHPDKNIGPYNDYYEATKYNFVIKTYLRFNIPIINSLLRIPIYTKTNAIYNCYGRNCEE